MEYRKACADDAQHLAELRKCQLIEEEFPKNMDIDTELLRYFKTSIEDDSYVGWLAVDKGEIVATSGVCFLQGPPTFSSPSGQVAYVTNMYTVPAYRRQGLASHLLSLVIQEARDRGVRLARLHASDDAVSVYRKFGFTDSDGFMRMEL